MEGRYPGDCGGCEVDADARRFDDEARSLGEGDEFRDRSSSFNRFVRNNPSNCTRSSFAHCSSYSPLGPFCDDPKAWSAMVSDSREICRVSDGATTPVYPYRSSNCSLSYVGIVAVDTPNRGSEVGDGLKNGGVDERDGTQVRHSPAKVRAMLVRLAV